MAPPKIKWEIENRVTHLIRYTRNFGNNRDCTSRIHRKLRATEELWRRRRLAKLRVNCELYQCHSGRMRPQWDKVRSGVFPVPRRAEPRIDPRAELLYALTCIYFVCTCVYPPVPRVSIQLDLPTSTRTDRISTTEVPKINYKAVCPQNLNLLFLLY